MSKVKTGDTVKVHYRGYLKDGTQFDNSRDREPLQFQLGADQVIQGFEDIVMDMRPGETRTGAIPQEEAYGPHQTERIIQTDRDQLPSHLEFEVGQVVEMRNQAGQVIPAIITRVTDTKIYSDANHPLAGKDLIFEIELLEIL